ncbi:uncharacterized protein [Watersipora subatra]|uniref:uncharacterized protein isoform X2 n=1 Tax=Watersipora subatra TaxID=2589382 RepID=UPI00355C9074
MDLREFFGRGDKYIHMSYLRHYLAASEDEYIPPPIPVPLPTFPELSDERAPFGDAWKKHFYLTEEFTFLNHGALGCSLKESVIMSQAYERYMDSQSLRAVDREIIPLLSHTLREMADFMGCDAQDIFFMPNCTSGISTVLRSLPFSKDESILTTSLGYGAVGYAVDRVCERYGAKHEKVQISLPITDTSEQIVKAVNQQLHEGIKLAIFDHIPSNVTFLMPIKELISLCKAKGIMVMIDGAHSLGQFDVNIRSYDPDFYMTNCHKWFANTRGSAVGYVRRELQHLIRPLVTSWGFDRGFSAEFIWNGTSYYSQYISLLATLNFWKAVGPQAIRDSCNGTISQAVKLLCQAWDVDPVAPSHLVGMVATVKLPARLNDETWKPAEGVKKDLIADCLYFKHKIEVPIRQVDGILYVRISCHIYNKLSDYEKLSAAILSICEERDSLINYNARFEQVPV